MSYKIIKSKDFNTITKETIRLKDICKTSNIKEIYTMDVYILDDNKRCPLLIETPVLTISSNIFSRNNYNYFFISLRNLEYDVFIDTILSVDIKHLGIYAFGNND